MRLTSYPPAKPYARFNLCDPLSPQAELPELSPSALTARVLAFTPFEWTDCLPKTPEKEKGNVPLEALFQRCLLVE